MLRWYLSPSPNFFEDWLQNWILGFIFHLYRFDIAHSRSKIIVVVKGEMPPKEKIPDGLYDYVRTRTYLSWQDPWFWKKLRYALPHKGTAKTRCFQGLFGHRGGNRHSDQLHLLQSGRTSQAMSTLTLDPSASSPDGSLNGLKAVNGRNNSVSPIWLWYYDKRKITYTHTHTDTQY